MLAPDLYKKLPHDSAEEDFGEWDQIVGAWSKAVRRDPPHRWIFRGHDKSYWPFETTLERAIQSQSELPQDETKKSQLPREYLQRGLKRHFAKRSRLDKRYIPVLDLEGGLIRRFQRQCHHYLIDTPQEDNLMEWLALMRHYGAPTRLMDWTWSFYVALFFAIHRSEAKRCAVWALDLDEVIRVMEPGVGKLIHRDPNLTEPKTFAGVFKRKRELVVNVSAFRLNDRLLVQQGTFLVPGNVAVPFEDNLAAVLKKINKPEALIKFTVSAGRKTKQDILRRLHEMNIGRATLFPGLDGFAQSLDQLLTIPDVLRPSNWWSRDNERP
jgi:hypothetical protein